MRFQGKPVRNIPRINSVTPKIKENNRSELRMFFVLKIKNRKETKP
tara:strand:+ start:80 stop:217 length:138 start_codon:yes stop_codon:yes gene_type:complete